VLPDQVAGTCAARILRRLCSTHLLHHLPQAPRLVEVVSPCRILLQRVCH
jgi:hypothetical protein